MTLNEMSERAHKNSCEKGWWDGVAHADPAVIPEKLMLIVTEVAEAMEDYRVIKLDTTVCVTNGKPEGLPSELADVVIRIGDLCGHLGIDLDREVRQKMAYNETRSIRHGGKKA